MQKIALFITLMFIVLIFGKSCSINLPSFDEPIHYVIEEYAEHYHIINTVVDIYSRDSSIGLSPVTLDDNLRQGSLSEFLYIDWDTFEDDYRQRGSFDYDKESLAKEVERFKRNLKKSSKQRLNSKLLNPEITLTTEPGAYKITFPIISTKGDYALIYIDFYTDGAMLILKKTNEQWEVVFYDSFWTT